MRIGQSNNHRITRKRALYQNILLFPRPSRFNWFCQNSSSVRRFTPRRSVPLFELSFASWSELRILSHLSLPPSPPLTAFALHNRKNLRIGVLGPTRTKNSNAGKGLGESAPHPSPH